MENLYNGENIPSLRSSARSSLLADPQNHVVTAVQMLLVDVRARMRCCLSAAMMLTSRLGVID